MLPPLLSQKVVQPRTPLQAVVRDQAEQASADGHEVERKRQPRVDLGVSIDRKGDSPGGDDRIQTGEFEAQGMRRVGIDDAEHHAREHLTVEMAVYLLHLFTDNYATDTRIKNVVNSREIWIIPQVNPDGSEYDISTVSPGIPAIRFT